MVVIIQEKAVEVYSGTGAVLAVALTNAAQETLEIRAQRIHMYVRKVKSCKDNLECFYSRNFCAVYSLGMEVGKCFNNCCSPMDCGLVVQETL